MHETVHRRFSELCRRYPAGGAMLEIGATPTADTLLALPELAGATSRIGINLDGPSQAAGFEIVGGNANAMPQFADASFDLVLCNATLEHDPHFWLTLAEIRRVLRPSGLAMLGVPGYLATKPLLSRLAGRVSRALPHAGSMASRPVRRCCMCMTIPATTIAFRNRRCARYCSTALRCSKSRR